MCFIYQNRYEKEVLLQQNVLLYTKWFHWILSEFTNHNEQDLVGYNDFIGLMNED
jgi:hypothetical protein